MLRNATFRTSLKPVSLIVLICLQSLANHLQSCQSTCQGQTYLMPCFLWWWAAVCANHNVFTDCSIFVFLILELSIQRANRFFGFHHIRMRMSGQSGMNYGLYRAVHFAHALMHLKKIIAAPLKIHSFMSWYQSNINTLPCTILGLNQISSMLNFIQYVLNKNSYKLIWTQLMKLVYLRLKSIA